MEDSASCNIHCSHTYLISFNLFPDSFSLLIGRVKILLNKPIYDDRCGNADNACDRDVDRHTERNAQDSKIQYERRRQAERLPVIEPCRREHAPDKTADHDPCQNQQKTCPSIFTHTNDILLSPTLILSQHTFDVYKNW